MCGEKCCIQTLANALTPYAIQIRLSLSKLIRIVVIIFASKILLWSRQILTRKLEKSLRVIFGVSSLQHNKPYDNTQAGPCMGHYIFASLSALPCVVILNMCDASHNIFVARTFECT